MSANEIFLFVINPPNEKPETQKLIAKHVFECFKVRNKKCEGRQKVDQMCVCVCNYHYICNKYTWEFVMYKICNNMEDCSFKSSGKQSGGIRSK